MTEPAAPPLRTWRPMAAWTAGIVLALGVAWFVGAVVVPVWQTRNTIRRCVASISLTGEFPIHQDFRQPPHAAERQAIDSLGGSRRAVAKLRVFRMAPDWFAERGAQPGQLGNKDWAVLLLGYCGKPGATELVPMLKAGGGRMRLLALLSAYRIGPDAAEALPAIQQLLSDEEPEVRDAATLALKKIRGEEPKP